jgi:hypothetical protein
MSTDNEQDRSRLAKLGEWRPMDTKLVWEDGTQFLAAVPVGSPEKWDYEYSVVTVHCGEDYCDLECNGESWGWSLDDVDFFIVLSGRAE